MIALGIVIMYIGMMVNTYRYTGGLYLKPYELGRMCAYSSICAACKCKNCGSSNRWHIGSREPLYHTHQCRNFEASGIHGADYFEAVVTAFIWPVWWSARLFSMATVNSSTTFFKEPAPILSREQKQALQIETQKKEKEERDAYILKLEKEVGLV